MMSRRPPTTYGGHAATNDLTQRGQSGLIAELPLRPSEADTEPVMTSSKYTPRVPLHSSRMRFSMRCPGPDNIHVTPQPFTEDARQCPPNRPH